MINVYKYAVQSIENGKLNKGKCYNKILYFLEKLL